MWVYSHHEGFFNFFFFTLFVMHGRPAETSETTGFSFVPASALAQNGAAGGVCL